MKQEKPTTISAYIAGFPKPVQQLLQQIRKTIQEAAPDATEAIKYGIPTFVLNGNLAHFAAFNSHIGFYPTPTGIEAFSKDLAKYHTGKGSIQFPLDQPMPLNLITKMVRWRAKQLAAKQEKKKPAGTTARKRTKPGPLRNE